MPGIFLLLFTLSVMPAGFFGFEVSAGGVPPPGVGMGLVFCATALTAMQQLSKASMGFNFIKTVFGYSDRLNRNFNHLRLRKDKDLDEWDNDKDENLAGLGSFFTSPEVFLRLAAPEGSG